MAKESSLTIQQFKVDFKLSQWGASAHQKNLRQFQKAIKGGMQQALTSNLLPLDNQGEQLLFIKKLELDCVLDLHADETTLFNYWACALKTKLALALRTQQSNRIALFESPADYCAAFLRALIAGNAWQQWYFRAFEGLKALPTSAAIRTLLLDDQQPAFAAIDRLTLDEVERLCVLLGQADCRIVCAQLDKQSTNPFDFNRLTQASLQYIFSALDGITLTSKANIQLYLAFYTNRLHDSEKFYLSESCVAALVELKALEQSLSEQQFTRFLQALYERDTQGLRTLLSTAQFAELAWLIALPVVAINNILQALKKSVQIKIETRSLTAARFTRFGNVLFLLQQLQQLPLPQRCEHWPNCVGIPADAMLRLLAVCTCQGAAKFGSALNDPVVQDLCGARAQKYSLTMAQVTQWLDFISDEKVADLKQQFQDFFSHRIAVTLGADAIGKSSIQSTIETAHGSFVIESESKKCLWSSIHFCENSLFGKEFPSLAQIEPAATDATTAPSPATRLVITDLQFLWPAVDRYFAAHNAGMICLLAQYSLRGFANRLPGFSFSSAQYLVENFLAMNLTLREKEQHFIAAISRVPMSVMLNMTGITRSTMQLPFFDGRPLHLHEVEGTL